MYPWGLSVLVVVAAVVTAGEAAQYKVKCLDEAMVVEIVRTPDMLDVFVEGLESYPDPACHPKVSGSLITLQLDLSERFQCGITKITNLITGQTTFQQRLVVRRTSSDKPKELLMVKCSTPGSILPEAKNHTVHRRNVLPAGFSEPEDLGTLTELVERAPTPHLTFAVRQSGRVVSGELNVSPGTPLQMEVYLDQRSAPVYGLLVGYMQVTDTAKQEETIIFNGCSVDPFLFENFNTVDGDFLTAKFRAFKFPESTYVQFKGTINVCLDKCKGVECSNGQVGYGRRRRREVGKVPADPNKVFEYSMSTYIRVDFVDDDLLKSPNDGVLRAFGRRNATQVVATNHVTDQERPPNQHLQLGSELVREDLTYTVVDQKSWANSPRISAIVAVFSAVTLLTV